MSRVAAGRYALWALVAALSAVVLSGVAVAQEPPAGDAAADTTPPEPPRRAADIAWNPRTTPEEIKALRRLEITEFDVTTRKPLLSTDDQKILEKFITNAIYSLTVEQEVDNHVLIIERRILTPIERGTTSSAARSYMRDTVLRVVEPLLFEGSQPPLVQFNLVNLVAQLNERAPDTSKRPPTPAVPYKEAHKLLLKAAKTQTLPIHARIMAVEGLLRFMRDGEASSVERADIGRDLSALLSETIDQPLAQKWFRLGLVDAIGYTNRLYDTTNKPVIIDSLLKRVADPQEDWMVRSFAARAVTQLPFEASTNVELVNHEIAKLCYELGTAYNASNDRKASKWRWSFTMVYLAYISRTEHDQKVRRWGLKSLSIPRGKAQIDAAYALMQPFLLMKINTGDGPNDPVPALIPAPQLQALSDWLSKNKPADRKATPASEELKDVPPSRDDANKTAGPQQSGLDVLTTSS